jgi:autophagy-related protein 16-1
MSIDFNSTGDSILASSNDNSIKIYDIDTKRSKLTLTGHSSKVYSAKFCLLDTVVSGSHDRTIKVNQF